MRSHSRIAGRSLAFLACAVVLTLAWPRLASIVFASGRFEATIKDDAGKPIADAVITLTMPGGATSPSRPAAAIMDQQNRMFVPHVLVVPVGTAVTFPNRDDIRHHVYSFSIPKRFELPLYTGMPAAPVRFDRPGVVVLGCNIHDWMVAYIYVSATPHVAKSAHDGVVRLADVTPGAYEARVWHPRMRADPEKSGKPVTITAGEPARVDFTVPLRAERRATPPAGGYERPQT